MFNGAFSCLCIKQGKRRSGETTEILPEVYASELSYIATKDFGLEDECLFFPETNLKHYAFD